MKTTTAAHYLLIALGLFATNLMFAAGGGTSHGGDLVFPIPETAYSEMEAYHADELGHELGLIEQLKIRAAADPFNVVATIIFFFAVVHTFLATIFNKIAHKFELEHRANVSSHNRIYVDGREPVSFKATLFHFLGEVEAIFGIWLIPLLISLVFMVPDGLSTAALRISSIFNISAAVDISPFIQYRGTDSKTAVWDIGLFHRSDCCFYQFVTHKLSFFDIRHPD